MSEYDKDFGNLPDVGRVFIKSKDFIGGKEVTFRGIKKIEPGSHEGEKILLRYSDTEFMFYKDKKPVLDDDGKQVPNPMFDPKFPNGYSLEILFDEGVFTCSSYPAYKLLKNLEPKAGDVLYIERVGDSTAAKWTVRKLGAAQPQAAQETDRPF